MLVPWPLGRAPNLSASAPLADQALLPQAPPSLYWPPPSPHVCYLRACSLPPFGHTCLITRSTVHSFNDTNSIKKRGKVCETLSRLPPQNLMAEDRERSDDNHANGKNEHLGCPTWEGTWPGPNQDSGRGTVGKE